MYSGNEYMDLLPFGYSASSGYGRNDQRRSNRSEIVSDPILVQTFDAALSIVINLSSRHIDHNIVHVLLRRVDGSEMVLLHLLLQEPTSGIDVELRRKVESRSWDGLVERIDLLETSLWHLVVVEEAETRIHPIVTSRRRLAPVGRTGS